MMDSNGGGVYPYNGVPMGFGLALAMNRDAFNNYSKLTEAEKEKILAESHNIKSREEMQQIIDSLF